MTNFILSYDLVWLITIREQQTKFKHLRNFWIYTGLKVFANICSILGKVPKLTFKNKVSLSYCALAVIDTQGYA